MLFRSSRVGGNAQIKAMKKVSGTLKLAYSQYRELQSFAQFGSDLDEDTKRRLAQGARIVEVLKQNRTAPIEVENQVAIIYAVTNNMLDDVKVEDIRDFEAELYEHLRANLDVMAEVREKGTMGAETTEKLKEAINTVKAAFLKTR